MTQMAYNHRSLSLLTVKPLGKGSKMGDGSDAVWHPVQPSARVVYGACGFPPPCLSWVCGQHDITHGN